MKRLALIFCFTFYFLYSSFAQSVTDSLHGCNLRISLLTCAPGEELYSTFGHTAIRVSDQLTGTDYAFNYGSFEFGPDFYAKFIRGKLLYYLSVENFDDFIHLYQIESRSVLEQVLQLTCDEKQKLLSALLINAQEENKYYRYDFLFDNCTTRAGEIVSKNTNTSVVFKNILPKNVPSFRNLIHSYLNAGNQYWSKLGIDLLLGAKLDRRVSNKEAMFLPDYLLKGFDSALVNNHPLVTPAATILQMPLLREKSFFTPGIVLSILLILVVGVSFSKSKWVIKTLSIFDFLFFFILGLTGILLLFMWFGTDHKLCGNNYNLLWALPTHVFMAFFVHRKNGWVGNYFKIVFWLSILLAITWFFLPQQMNNALIPVLLLIIYRSWQLSKTKLYARKRNYT